MTIRYGYPANGNGGGISYESTGTLTLSDCTVSKNECADGIGGGLFQENTGGTITISQSVFDVNKSNDGDGNGGNGGAIACISDATINIDQSTFKNNYAYWNGGGVYLENSGLTASISNSTFYNNEADNWGGGFIIEQGDVTIVNSTFSGNSTTNSEKGGGAIAIWSQSAILKFLTVANNTAAGRGAGLFFDTDNTGTFYISNCLSANNTGNGTGDDLYNNSANLVDNGYNIVEVCNLAATASGGLDEATDILYNTKYGDGTTSYTAWNRNGTDLTNQNLNLSSTLADNSGSTETLAISSGSFAISAGSYDGSYTTDQRGETRLDPPTIGAFEYPVALATVTTTAASAIGFMDATSGGEVTDDGNGIVSEKGICSNKIGTPTIIAGDPVVNIKKKDYSGQNPFTKIIYDLVPYTTYYIRAYAINSAGTAYGNEVSFSTTSYGLASAPTAGIGSEADPYEISSLNELAWMMETESSWDSYFELTANIDASASSAWDGGKGFAPIGREIPTEDQFNGYLEGNGFTISNLYVNRPYTNDVGLFGYTDRNYSQEISYVQNLGLTSVNLTGGYRTASLISRSTSLVSNCYVTGSVTGAKSNSVAAGLIGQSHELVQNSYSRASVYARYAAAGFISFNNSDIEKCYSTGAVSGDGDTDEDGFCNDSDGHGTGTISNSFWDTETSGQSSSSGGTGKTTAEMKTKSTFTDAGWDFLGESTNGDNDYWGMEIGVNDAYAYLTMQKAEWTGTSSSVWNLAENWSINAIPPAVFDIVIPDVANDPEIGATETITCQGLTVESEATLTIESSATGTGSLIVSGTSTGNVNAERYVTETYWHYISSPVAGQTLDNWMGNNSIVNTPPYQFFRWDEDQNYWIIYGSTEDPEAFTDTEFGVGKGYAAARSGDGDYTFTGTVTTSAVNAPVTYNANQGNGFNLVGNPFTSTIAITVQAHDTENFLSDNSGILADNYQAVYIWKETSAYTYGDNDYSVICNTGFVGQGNGSQINKDYIQPGQAFMVKVEYSGNIVFNTDIRKHGTADYYKSKESWPGLELRIANNEHSNSTIIAFNEDMTNGLDPSYDVVKFKGNPNLALYSHLVENTGKDYSVQALPNQNIEDYIIPIGVDVAESSVFEFSVYQENLDIYNIVLEDRQENTFTNLRWDTYFADISESGTGRFYLHFKDATAIGEINPQNNINIFAADNQIFIEGAENGIVQVLDIMGRIVLEEKISASELTSIPVDLKTGVYVVMVNYRAEKHASLYKTEKVFIK